MAEHILWAAVYETLHASFLYANSDYVYICLTYEKLYIPT